MPQAVAFAAAFAASNAAAAIGATVATQALIASAVAATTAAIAPIVILGALSYAAGLLNRPSLPKPSDGQVETKQAVPPRMWHYGRMKVAGPLAFYEIGDANVSYGMDYGGTLYKIVLLSQRQAAEIQRLYFDDTLATLNANGYTVDNSFIQSGHSHVRVWLHDGADDEVVDPVLADSFAEWTSTHRLQGIAYAVVTMDSPDNPEDYSEAYPQGEPQFAAVGLWTKVYDPRRDSTVDEGSGASGSGTHRFDDPSTWEWSNNVALCILDYLTHDDGYRRPIEKLDLPSFMAMADLCEEIVDLKAGGSEKRYRLATTVYLTEARTDVLQRLLEACDGEIFPTSTGKMALRGGEWAEPAVEIDLDAGAIIEAQWTGGADALSRYNELSIKYLSPAHKWTEVEGEAWQNESDEDFIAGRIETRPLDLLQVPSHGQARRLAKIRMARDNPEWIGELRTNYLGLNAIGERCITVKFSELGIDGPFWVDEATLLGDGTGMLLKVRSADPAAYEWDPEAEEGSPPPVPVDIAGPDPDPGTD